MSPPKPRPEGLAALRDRALGLLARREHSRFELRRKLSDAAPEPGELDAVLDDLAAAGLQSDRRYAESFVRSRIERGQGPLRIRKELRQRGVEAALAEQALAEAEVDWDARLRDVHRKRFGSTPPTDRREQARQARFLAQRGFPDAAIRDLLTDPGEA